MKKRRIKSGRPQIAGDRFPCGKRRVAKSQIGSLAMATAETVEKRAALVGLDNAGDQKAGTPFGTCFLAGKLTERRWSAAQQVESIWRRWAQYANSPRRVAGANAPGASGDELDAATWERLDATYRGIREAISRTRYGALSLSIIEGMACDQIMPPRFLRRDGQWCPSVDASYWAIGWEALYDGLDAAADWLRIPIARAA